MSIDPIDRLTLACADVEGDSVHFTRLVDSHRVAVTAIEDGAHVVVHLDVEGQTLLRDWLTETLAGPGSTSPEPGPAAAILADGPVSELATEVHGLLGALGRRARERREAASPDLSCTGLCDRETPGEHAVDCLNGHTEAEAVEAFLATADAQLMEDIEAAMPRCQPIGCDGGYHLAGCPVAEEIQMATDETRLAAGDGDTR